MVENIKEWSIQSGKQVDDISDSKEQVDARNWLRNNSFEEVDVLNDSENVLVDGSDLKSDPSAATHTTNIFSDTDTINKISIRKLYPLFIKPGIKDVETRSRASCGSPTFVAMTVSSTQIRNQDIFSPINSSTARMVRNVEPFNASINQIPAVNRHSTSYFSGVSGAETVSAEVSNVNPCERVNFASNAVFGKNPKFVDLGLSPAHTSDKLKSIIGTAARVRGLTDNFDGLAARHGIAKVTADRVSEAKAYSDYIRNSKFENLKMFLGLD